MARPSLSRALGVWMNGIRVGTWRLPLRAPEEFEYDPAWVASKLYRPLSLSMPAPSGGGPIRGDVVSNYFDNLLPDNDTIRRRIQVRFHTKSLSAFDLLAAVGRDCVGAIQLLHEDEAAPDVKTIEFKSLDDAGVERELIRAANMLGALGQQETDDENLRISLAGAQEKTALLFHRGRWCRPIGATPSTHIFKLPLGTVGGRKLDLNTSVENEWLCLKLLEAFGLPVAKADIKTFGSQKCLVVERFDRVLHSSKKYWLRLAQEDMCQATGTASSLKYEADGGPGIVRIATQLKLSEDQGDVERFLKTQILFWLLRATDGHAKNFSIRLNAGGSFSLSPTYDVISTWPIIGKGANLIPTQDIKMAMAWIGKSRHYHADHILPRHFVETAQRCGIKDGLASYFGELLHMAPIAIKQVQAQLPAKFPDHVSRSIFVGLLGSVQKLKI